VPESEALLAERLEYLGRRLSELSPKVQAAILWHHRDGYTCEEIGERLSVVRNRVKKYLGKGLAHCRGEPAVGAV
jgi:RNA polymerase sigma-70 factor (ECF subfamily)